MTDDAALNYRRSTVGLPPASRVSRMFSADLAAIQGLPETSGRDRESAREDVAYAFARTLATIRALPTYGGAR